MENFNTEIAKVQLNFTQNVDEIIRQLATDHGFSNLPLYFKLDGKRHRFGTKAERTPYWYIGEYLEDGHFKVSFGAHKSVGKTPFTYFSNHLEKSKKIGDMDFLERFEASSPYGSSVYLQEKKLGSDLYGARISPLKSLVIPMYFEDSLVGVHTIWRNSPGEKYKKATCGRAKGTYFELVYPDIKIKDTIFVCEGFSTAASILLATKTRTVCSFGAENLKFVAKYFSEKNPGVRILIAADNDDVGLMAAYNSGFLFVAPNIAGKDWNDIHMEIGLEEVKRQISDIMFKPAAGALPPNYPPKPAAGAPEPVSYDIPFFDDKTEEEFDDLSEISEDIIFDLRRGDLGIIAGLAKDGKSGLAVSLAVQIATDAKKGFLGLGHLKGGNVCIATISHDMSYYEALIDGLKPFISCDENKLLESSLAVLDCTKHTQKMSSDIIMSELYSLKNSRDFLDGLRLLIIDDVTKWDETNLNDSSSVSKMIEVFKKLAFKLDVAILLLSPVIKNVFFVGKTNKPNIAGCFGQSKLPFYVPWMFAISDAKGIDLKNFNNETKNNPRMLMLLGSSRNDVSIPISKRDDVCHLLIQHNLKLDPYNAESKQEIASEDKPVDISIVGADIKNGAVAMPSDLLKTKGIFGSFATWQQRPSFCVEIKTSSSLIKIKGIKMFNGLDLRLLSVLTEKAAKSGTRVLLKNSAERYEDIVLASTGRPIQDGNGIPIFIFQTTFYDVTKSLGIDNPGKTQYNYILNSLETLSDCKILFSSLKEIYDLPFLEFHVDKVTNKITLKMCPFLASSILGLSHYSLIETEAVRLINSDLSYILYQSICSRLSYGETLEFKDTTLLEYIFPTSTTINNLKDRRKSLKQAIIGLQNDFKGLSFKLLEKSKWQVTRIKV